MMIGPELPEGYQGVALRTPTLPPAAHTNCYVVGHHEALVVDPGSAYRGELQRLLELLWRLRGTGGNVAAVLLTHQHRDHVGGAVTVAVHFGVPIVAHAKTLAALPVRGKQRKQPALEAIDEQASFVVDPDRRIEVLHTLGHAAGHLCLFEPLQRVLLAGDMVPGIGTTVIDPPEGDMAVYLQSLQRLAALDPAWVLPSHGPALRDGRLAIERLIAHRLLREQKICAALEAGRSIDLWAITRQAYDDVPAMVWPLASRSALAHLLKLEAEQKVRRVGTSRWTLRE